MKWAGNGHEVASEGVKVARNEDEVVSEEVKRAGNEYEVASEGVKRLRNEDEMVSGGPVHRIVPKIFYSIIINNQKNNHYATIRTSTGIQPL